MHVDVYQLSLESVGIVIHYVLPVLWMTSYFHVGLMGLYGASCKAYRPIPIPADVWSPVLATVMYFCLSAVCPLHLHIS